MNSKARQYYWQDFIDDCTHYNAIDPDDLIELENYLSKRRLHGRCTSLSMADGFLAALAVGPCNIPRGRYQGLELVWGKVTNRSASEMKSSKKKEKLAELLHIQLRNIVYFLTTERTMYVPMRSGQVRKASGSEGGYQQTPPFIDWCQGFMKYVDMNAEAWTPIFGTEFGTTLMSPFIYFGSDSGWSKEKETASDTELYRSATFTLKHDYFLLGIKDFFDPPYMFEDSKEFQKVISEYWSVPAKYLQTVHVPRHV